MARRPFTPRIEDPIDEEMLDGSILDVPLEGLWHCGQSSLVEPRVDDTEAFFRLLRRDRRGCRHAVIDIDRLVDTEVDRDGNGLAELASCSLGVTMANIVLVEKQVAVVGC